MSNEHPARLASQRSMEAVHKKDKQAWLDNFADDAVVEDPIGVSALDPTGKGRQRWVRRWKAPLNAFELAFPGRLTTSRN